MSRQNKEQHDDEHIYNLLGSKENGFRIGDDFIAEVSKHFEVSSPLLWPFYDPYTLCSGIVTVFLNLYSLNKN